MISTDDVANTIINLKRAGKSMPKRDDDETAVDSLKSTVKLWHDLFAKENPVIWQKATEIVLKLTRVEGSNLNVNLITPALMQYAITKATEYRVSEVRREEQKNTEVGEKNQTLWKWTLERLKKRLPFGAFMPSSKEIEEYGALMGLTTAEIERDKQLLRIYLCDVKTAAHSGGYPKSQLYVNDERQVVYVP